MKKLSFVFVGIGFIWLSLWSLFGGLIGAKLQTFDHAADKIWMSSLSRELVRSLHAHMNAFGFGLIFFGLTIPLAYKFTLNRYIPYISMSHLFSIMVFSLGLILKIIFVGSLSSASWLESASIFSLSLGSFFYIVSTAAWGLLFLIEGWKK
jgi:hypothetical protein